MLVYNMTFSLSAEVNFIKWQRHIQDGYIKRALAHDFEDFKLMRLIRTPHGDPTGARSEAIRVPFVHSLCL